MRWSNLGRNYRETTAFLRPYTRRYVSNYCVFCIGWLTNTGLSIVMPVLLGILIDELVYYHNTESFFRVCGVLAGVIAFYCILQFFIYAQHQFLNSALTHDIKEDVLKHLFFGRASTLADLSQGDVLNTVQTYTSECLQFTIRNVIHLFIGIIKLIILVIVLFRMDWRFGIVMMIAAPVHVFISSKLGDKANLRGEKQRKICSIYNSWLLDVISNTREIRHCNAQGRMQKDFVDAQKNLNHEEMNVDQIQLLSENCIMFVNLIIKLFIYSLAAFIAMHGGMTIGKLTIIFALMELLTDQIKWSSSSFVDAQRRIAYINHVKAILTIPMEENGEKKANLIVKEGSIEFDNVSFAYPEAKENVLDKVNLCISGREKIGIVGKSGCGKTTLIYALLGLYPVDNGVIRIDGQNIAECNTESVRNSIGIVSQDILLYNTTIRENLTIAKSDATENEMIEACKNAGLADYLQSSPHGIDTKIGLNGANLSGGERQRLAIARIFLKNPRIVVFDEATSALDIQTEKSLLKTIFSVMEGRTVVFISHNQEPLMRCDKIVQMKAGKIHAISDSFCAVMAESSD